MTRLRAIQDRIVHACTAVGRDPQSVTLIAVSKTKSIDAIRELYDLGQRDFGESRLQEAEPKVEALPKDIRWHFIGHLQSNKAKRVAELFSVIHTIENTRQLREIEKANRCVEGFVEINIAKEPQKTGIFAEDLDEFLDQVLDYRQVQIRGLMMIGPAEAEPNLMRSYFAQIRRLADACGLSLLSMGMSDNFDLAIKEGSTHVRVGTALFGER